ncbi:MAG: 5-formyltetrahydrofolate cyclo-ligase [Micromonosporaceae bacterium]|jgi:5-formyltetrahydrofolate cyclo-ligase|nr:5-formyltetrahydrofolate cyclo-ligase [Micromonosporaceae bacterium]
MEHSAAAAAKTEARGNLLTARRSLPAEVRHQAAVRVQAELVALVRAIRPAVIASYVPMANEPGGADLPEVLAAHGPLLLPVLRTDLDLDWAYFAGSESLSGAPLREPRGPRLGPAAVSGADLVVVPAVAVDRTGMRLGRGGGSYDRALTRVRPDALVVALLFDGELVEALPAEPHDARVGAAIMPSTGLVRLPVRGS